MGSHRGAGRPRKVSRGVIVAAIAVVIVVALVIGWLKVRDTASEREEQATASCVAGEATLTVAADPAIADALRTLAERYADTDPVVRDQCISVAVDAVATEQAAAALTAGTWDEAAMGPRPALWVPLSSASIRAVPHEGDPRSIAGSPVVLATPPALAEALRSANITWGDLPRLQADPNSLAALGLSDWGALRLALSAPLAGPSLLAVESVATAANGGPLAAESVTSAPVTTALTQLGTRAADSAELAALADQPDPRSAAVHAVPAVEPQVRAARTDTITTFAPGGVAAVADFPGVAVTGDWVDETRHRAASLFVDYVRQPDQASVLSDSGFRVGTDDATPTPAPIRDALAERYAAQTRGTATTVLVDVSSSMGTGDRLTGVTNALRSYVAAAPETAALGLWSYSRNLDGATPYRDEVRTEPLNADRKRILDDVLARLAAGTATRDQAYPTLIAAYSAAVPNFIPGQTNSILLVTDGPDDDSSVTGRALLDAIAAATDPARPVRIDVIALGDRDPTDTVRELTSRTGGSLTRVAPADLPAAFAAALAP